MQRDWTYRAHDHGDQGNDGPMHRRHRPRSLCGTLVAVAVLTAACTAEPDTGGPTASNSRTSGATTLAPTPATSEESVVPTDDEFPPYTYLIAPVTEERLGASYQPGCPVTPDNLRLLTLAYVTFDGTSATGELVVAAELAEPVAMVFGELYMMRFPIRSMRTVEEFGADDNASMGVDNTSAFNCRAITGGSDWSLHSYGVAIDVNPRENPYVSGDTVLPPEGRDYLDRNTPRPGMIIDADAVVAAFAAAGFSWGGDWTDPIDYQHFEHVER